MKANSYVTYAQVEQQAMQHMKLYGSKTGFLKIVTKLFENGQAKPSQPVLPHDTNWSFLDDQAFYELLNNLPVTDTLFQSKSFPSATVEANSHAPSIEAESIMPNDLEVYAIKYVRDIIEKMHTHNYFEVNYVMMGKCSMIFENKTRELSCGELCFIAPQSRHDVTVSDDSIVISLMIRKNTFESTFFKLLAQEDLLASFFRSILYSNKSSANYMMFTTNNSNDIINTIKDIFMESYVSDKYSNTCIISRIHLFFSLLLRNFSDTIQFYDNERNDNKHENFSQVLQYIQQNYQNVTLPDLANTFHYNPSYICRMIKKNTGRTLVDILTNLKLTKASELLLQTDLKIEEISSMVGYENVDHFSKLFKRYYHLPPKKYRGSITS